MLGIDWKVVVQGVDWVFRFFVRLGVLRRLDNDVRDAVADDWRRGWITQTHAHREFNMCHFYPVRFSLLGESFRDHELREIELVHQQIGNHALHVLDGALHVALHQNFLEHSFNDLTHEQAVITTHGFNPFRVHFIMFLSVCPEQTSVTLLANQEVRPVDFFKLELDGLEKRFRHKSRGFFAEFHGFGQVWGVEFNHHRISVTVDDFSVSRVSIDSSILVFDEVLRVINHRTPVRRRGG
mmetsp:Transcript_6122/g.22093  ORF Transcript_6122/g.22093 Transcript_6122/m.22093 type:complete len:239 (-) Transcript_6122:2203-2919(-)